MVDQIPDGITRDHVLNALADHQGQRVAHRFKDSVDYDLLHNGERFPPKAILGIAARYVTGTPLTPGQFSSGDDSKCFRILRRLGFEIVPKSDKSRRSDNPAAEAYRAGREDRITATDEPAAGGGQDRPAPRAWSEEENAATVQTYFEMFTRMLNGESLIKTQFHKRLILRLNGRNEGAVKRKFENISACLGELGIPAMQGYSGTSNRYQRSLLDAVKGYLAKNPEFGADLESDPRELPVIRQDTGSMVAVEGRIRFKLHRCRERDRSIVKQKKESVLNTTGRLACESCGMTFCEVYAGIADDFIECHHRQPLGTLDRQDTVTMLSDLALVCANCHRVLHLNPNLSVEDLRFRLHNMLKTP